MIKEKYLKQHYWSFNFDNKFGWVWTDPESGEQYTEEEDALIIQKKRDSAQQVVEADARKRGLT